MEREPKNEAEKVKKVEKAPEMENDEVEDYEDEEAMESYGEESHFEAPAITSCLPSSTLADSSEESATEIASTSTDQADSYRTKREKAIMMKWQTVTGRKPLNIPLAMVYKPKGEKDEKRELVPFFGERRPLMIENQRKENWMKLSMKKEMEKSYFNPGRVLWEIRLTEAFRGLRCLRFSPNSKSMVTTFGNGVVQIRKSTTGEVTNTLQTLETLYRLEITAARYHPRTETRIYVGGGTGLIQVFDENNPKCIGSVREKNNEIYNLDLSPDGSLLVSVGKDGNVYIYDAHRLRLLSLQSRPPLDDITLEKEQSYHHMRIYGLKCHPTEPNLFVTGGWDLTVKLWDTRVCGAVHTIHGPRICGDSIDVRGNEILTGSWSATNSLKLWDLSSGKILRNISVANRSSPLIGEFIYVARFFMSGTNSILVGGNGTEEVEVINIDNNMAVASFPGLKAVVALDSYDNIIAYGGMESILRFGELQQPLKFKISSRK